MNGRLYPFGYFAPNAQQTLDARMADKRAVLVDIRYHAYSKRPEWTGEALYQRYGSRYRALPSLGNVNHSNGKEIRLSNEKHGIPLLLDGLRKGYTLILLCACKDFSTCHRRKVVELVKAAMPDVEVVPEETQSELRSMER